MTALVIAIVAAFVLDAALLASVVADIAHGRRASRLVLFCAVTSVLLGVSALAQLGVS